MGDCQKNNPPFNQCCCECKFLAALNLHEMTVENYDKSKHGCVCDIQVGWVCMVFALMVENGEMPRVQLWKQHSCGCEMHEKRGK